MCVCVVAPNNAGLNEPLLTKHYIRTNKTSTIAKVKKAYHKLALKYHPDKSSKIDAADHFRTLSEAYSLLSSPSKKKFYDQELMARAMSCC